MNPEFFGHTYDSYFGNDWQGTHSNGHLEFLTEFSNIFKAFPESIIFFEVE